MSLDSAAAVLFDALKSRGLTLAGAESCTGGLVSAALTELPGASSVFLGSVVSYSNEAKRRLLGVRTETLESHGAVSAECAGEMARGAARAFSADCSFAVTGIAGPSGGLPDKPVGTVWLAFVAGGSLAVERLSLSGDRRRIREESAERALAGLLAMVSGQTDPLRNLA